MGGGGGGGWRGVEGVEEVGGRERERARALPSSISTVIFDDEN